MSTFTPNSTQVLDIYLDLYMSLLTGAEWKVLCYTIRRTFGFQKVSDCISTAQYVHGIVKQDGTRLDRGTGLRKAAVEKAIKELIGFGLMERSGKPGKTPRYKLQRDSDKVKVEDLETRYRTGLESGKQRIAKARSSQIALTPPVGQDTTPPVGQDTQYTVTNIPADQESIDTNVSILTAHPAGATVDTSNLSLEAQTLLHELETRKVITCVQPCFKRDAAEELIKAGLADASYMPNGRTMVQITRPRQSLTESKTLPEKEFDPDPVAVVQASLAAEFLPSSDDNGQSKDVIMRYTYAMRNRPAFYGTCPDGRLIDLDKPHVPTDDDQTYGTVTYDKPLSQRELYRYEMLPVDPLPTLPLWPEGAHIERIGNHKVFILEAIDGDYYAGDHRLIDLRDWCQYDIVQLPDPPRETPAAPALPEVPEGYRVVYSNIERHYVSLSGKGTQTACKRHLSTYQMLSVFHPGIRPFPKQCPDCAVKAAKAAAPKAGRKAKAERDVLFKAVATGIMGYAPENGTQYTRNQCQLINSIKGAIMRVMNLARTPEDYQKGADGIPLYKKHFKGKHPNLDYPTHASFEGYFKEWADSILPAATLDTSCPHCHGDKYVLIRDAKGIDLAVPCECQKATTP